MAKNRFIAPTRNKASIKEKKKQEEIFNPKINVLILGGLPICRKKSYGPSPLIDIDGESIFTKTVNEINLAFPNNNMVLTTGFEAKKVFKVMPSDIRMAENLNFETTNLAEELRIGINASERENLLVVNSGCLLDSESYRQIPTDESCIICKQRSKNDNPLMVGVLSNKGKVYNFCYDFDDVWCEIMFLKSKEIQILQNIFNQDGRSKFFMFEILNLLLKRNGTLKAIYPEDIEFTKI